MIKKRDRMKRIYWVVVTVSILAVIVGVNYEYAEKPYIQNGTYLRTRCCVNSTDMNCCDFFQVGMECDEVIMR